MIAVASLRYWPTKASMHRDYVCHDLFKMSALNNVYARTNSLLLSS